MRSVVICLVVALTTIAFSSTAGAGTMRAMGTNGIQYVGDSDSNDVEVSTFKWSSKGTVYNYLFVYDSAHSVTNADPTKLSCVATRASSLTCRLTSGEAIRAQVGLLGGNDTAEVVSEDPDIDLYLDGQEDDDRIFGSDDDNAYLTGGNGSNVVVGNGGDDYIKGHNTAEDIILGDELDLSFAGISSSTGDDTIVAGGGDDLIGAGPGDDTVKGGRGADEIFGEQGADTLYGNTSSDSADSAEDRIYGDSGTGPAGHDIIDVEDSGDGVPDRVYCETAGDDTLSINSGIDLTFAC